MNKHDTAIALLKSRGASDDDIARWIAEGERMRALPRAERAAEFVRFLTENFGSHIKTIHVGSKKVFSGNN